MGKQKHFKVKGFLNFLYESEIHAVPKTCEKWISIVRESMRKYKYFKFIGFLNISVGSSLIYNTNARHEQTSATRATQMQHEWHECNTSETGATRLQHKCNTSATWMTRVQHEWYMNDTSVTRVLHERHECGTSEKFDFDNETSKNIFSYPYIYYMASERLQREKQFHSKNQLLEMPPFYAKMRLKSAPQILNFLMAKAISKSCIVGCCC